MIKEVYQDALAVLAKKPVRLWGISLLAEVLVLVFSFMFSLIPGVSIAISLLIGTGLLMVFCHGLHGEQVYAVQLFDCFRDWATIKRVLCGLGWMMLWLFLWALIPIVGWIFALIRAYAWRLTPYILMFEPDVAPTQAIKVSEARTKGFKGQMFWADVLPIIGFAVAVLVLSLLALIPFIGVLFRIILILVVIAFYLFITLFLGLVQVDFYEKIMAKEEQAALLEASKTVCPNCGELVSGGSFCPNCGTKLE